MKFNKDLTNKSIFILSLLGLFLSLYLWYVHVLNIIPTCGVSGCEDVLSGEYSTVFEVPVAALGAFYYSLLLLVTFFRLFIDHKVLDWTLRSFVFTGVVYTVYLRYLEFVKIGDWCQWCWGSVVIILLIMILLGFEFYSSRKLSE